jgi:hypothetical protein
MASNPSAFLEFPKFPIRMDHGSLRFSSKRFPVIPVALHGILEKLRISQELHRDCDGGGSKEVANP